MARKLDTKTNIIAPGGDYPFGRVKDNSGANDGTPVDEVLLGDIIQFFEKLMSDAGVTFNNLPENNTDGFQFITALEAYIRARAASTTQKGTVEKATQTETNTGTDNERFITPALIAAATAIIKTAAIENSAVTNPKIADGAINGAKIANASVGTSQLIDAAVTLSKMAANSVDTLKLVDNSVTDPKLAPLPNNSSWTLLSPNAETNISYANNTVRAYEDGRGVVWVKGTIDITSSGATPAKITPFILPVALAPDRRVQIGGSTVAGGVLAEPRAIFIYSSSDPTPRELTVNAPTSGETDNWSFDFCFVKNATV